MEPSGRTLPVESHPRLVGFAAAVGAALLVGLVWVVAPTVAFVLAFAGQFLAFGGLFMFAQDRDGDGNPRRDFGTLPEYSDDGFADAWIETVASGADADRGEAVIRATRVFLVSLLVGCVLLMFLGARFAAAVGSLVGLG